MAKSKLFTFFLNKNLYGIDVNSVQEITKPLGITKVPHAPVYIKGLVNLRGQIVSVVDAKILFGLSEKEKSDYHNFVICNIEKTLIAIMADDVGDVVEVEEKDFDMTPDTVGEQVRNYLSGVYKLPNQILSLIDFNKITEAINK